MKLRRPRNAPRKIPLSWWHMDAWIRGGRRGPRPSRAPKRMPPTFHWWRLWRLARVKGKGSWAWKTYLHHLHAQADAQARLNRARGAVVRWAEYGIAHRAEIHYSQGLARDDFLFQRRGHLPMTTDCSGWVTQCYWAAALPDPSGLNYRWVGFTGTILENAYRHGRVLTDLSLARPGDPIVIGPGTGWHVVICLEAGSDPIVGSHGSEPGPLSRHASYDPRAPKRVCQTLS